MATRRKAKTEDAGDGGSEQVQDTVDKIEEKGYIGQTADGLPNSAHSLESGPDAPTAAEQRAAAAEAQAGGGAE